MFKSLLILGLILGIVASAGAQNEERDQLVLGNITFAFHLYDALVEENPNRNLIFSPYSISQAFAMAYAGARGNTQTEMQAVFDFRLSQERLPLVFQDLTASFAPADASPDIYTPFQLTIANALWGQADFGFNAAYLTLMNNTYGAHFELMDFKNEPENARQKINHWVMQATEDRISELLPASSLTPETLLVLTNAIYFKAEWEYSFIPSFTADEPFILLDGSTVTVPLMREVSYFLYTEGDMYQAVSLPYMGSQIAMLILLPKSGQFEAFEAALGQALYTEIWLGLKAQRIQLYLPRFQTDFDVEMKATLQGMGLVDAFEDTADFTGMIAPDNPAKLKIDQVFHRAFIKVDESGTESEFVLVEIFPTSGGGVLPDPIIFRANHPFVYMIYDRTTGSILFLGRVMNPTE